MTINQLLRESYALGFEDTGELNDSFIFSANRALGIICSDIVPEKQARFIISAPEISYRMASYRHTPGKTFKINIKGTSFSFKFSGTGTVSITEKNTRKIKNFNSKNGIFKEAFNSECELKFTGALAFSIYDLTVYSTRISANNDSIPVYSSMKDISLSEYIPDFGIITRLPENSAGEVIEKATVHGDVMRLPFEWDGEISVYYKPCPTVLSANDPDAKISIPKFAEHLLPLLTASYLWIDDDPEKAEYYASVYRSEMNKIIITQSRSAGAEYKDILGWA